MLPLLGAGVPEELGPFLDLLTTEETRRALAVGLCAEEIFTVDQAAKLAGLDHPSFLRHLALHGIFPGGTGEPAAILDGIGGRPRDIDQAGVTLEQEVHALPYLAK